MFNQLTLNPILLDWSRETLPTISHYFEDRDPRDLLSDAGALFGDQLVMATGFGLSGIVLMHMLSQIRPETTIFYLQTDLHFPETMSLRDRLADRLGLRFEEIHCGLSLDEQAAQYGPDLWQRNPDQCCYIRKVVPLRNFLSDKAAWISGIRRDQSPSRANAPLVMWDRANHLIKLNPLANWNKKEIWRYIYAHNLPYNDLHDRGYPSIGCLPCTHPVNGPNDGQRAGRWAGRSKTECGIHLQETFPLRGAAL